MIYSKNYLSKIFSRTLAAVLACSFIPLSTACERSNSNQNNSTQNSAPVDKVNEIKYGSADKARPNIIIMLADDMGYSDIGCFGGDIDTPNLDKLASNGVRLTEFYNGARCSPSRASLLTGLYPHEAGMPHLQGRFGEYTRGLTENSVTIPRVLKESGYDTYMTGKWHVGNPPAHQKGFDKAYVVGGGNFFKADGQLNGVKAASKIPQKEYYKTDDIMDRSIEFIKDHNNKKPNEPFFEYIAFTAPHFPLHAKEEDIAKYKGRFDKGWDAMRPEKFKRMQQMGLIDPAWELSPSISSRMRFSNADFNVPSWNSMTSAEKQWRIRAMEVYAAMVDNLDQNVGKLTKYLEETGQLENTLILFFSDNGGNAEFPRIKNLSKLPGGPTYDVGNGHYGLGWANYSNTPFRMYKHYVHEGGIASPFIAHWPAVLKEKGAIRNKPAQLTDIMATVVDITKSKYPANLNGKEIMPMEGTSMMPIFLSNTSSKEYLFWEHEGNSSVRYKNWKLVKVFEQNWELYDLDKDGTEVHNLAKQHPDIVEKLKTEYEKWAERAKVLPYDELMKFGNENEEDGEEE